MGVPLYLRQYDTKLKDLENKDKWKPNNVETEYSPINKLRSRIPESIEWKKIIRLAQRLLWINMLSSNLRHNLCRRLTREYMQISCNRIWCAFAFSAVFSCLFSSVYQKRTQTRVYVGLMSRTLQASRANIQKGHCNVQYIKKIRWKKEHEEKASMGDDLA